MQLKYIGKNATMALLVKGGLKEEVKPKQIVEVDNMDVRRSDWLLKNNFIELKMEDKVKPLTPAKIKKLLKTIADCTEAEMLNEIDVENEEVNEAIEAKKEELKELEELEKEDEGEEKKVKVEDDGKDEITVE
jgi:3-hydroxyacyl-CoA dehydrogenase